MTAVEIVTIRQNDATPARLMETRATMLAEYAARYPTVSAQLFEQEDGTLVDIWTWPDRASAEAALDDPTVSPTFSGEWQSLVEVVSLNWADPVDG